MESPLSVSLPPAKTRVGFCTNTSSHITSHTTSETCFILAQGFGPQAQLSSHEAGDTAISAEELLVKKEFYFRAPRRRIVQLFKVVARTFWKIKMKTPEVAAIMGVVYISEKFWWTACLAGFSVYLRRGNQLVPVLPIDQIYDDFFLAKQNMWNQKPLMEN